MATFQVSWMPLAMNKNFGSTDRTVRILVAALIAALYFTGLISGTAAIIPGTLALVFLITGFINFCPIRWVLGISTRKKEDAEKAERGPGAAWTGPSVVHNGPPKSG